MTSVISGDDDVPLQKNYVEIGDSSENVLHPGTDNYSNALDKSKSTRKKRRRRKKVKGASSSSQSVNMDQAFGECCVFLSLPVRSSF
jgi:hypothetical protein